MIVGLLAREVGWLRRGVRGCSPNRWVEPSDAPCLASLWTSTIAEPMPIVSGPLPTVVAASVS